MMRRVICCTGSGGFVGKNLVTYLDLQGFEVFRWDRKHIDDIGKCDYLVHLAGRAHKMKDSSDDALRDFRKVNVDLTLSLAKVSLEKKIKKFIFISSVKVMGEKMGNYSEDDRANPDDPYGRSKLEAEHSLRELFKKQLDSQCIIIRLPIIYGSQNKGNMLSLLNAANKKMLLPLKNASGKRSMLYVRNLSDAVLNIINDKVPDRPRVQTYFLNDGVDITSGELYSTIFQAMHSRMGVFSVPVPILRFGGKVCSHVEKLTGKSLLFNQRIMNRLFDEYRFSNEKFCNDYNWKPPYTFQEGLKETVEWYLDRESLKSAHLSGKKERKKAIS